MAPAIAFNFFLTITLSFLLLAPPADGSRRFQRRSDLENVPPIGSWGYTVPLEGSKTCRSSGECTTMLRPPSNNKSLKYLSIARGMVGYSCEGRQSTDQPLFMSQTTSLWDAAPLLPHIANEELFHTIIPQLYEFDYTELANSSLVCIGTIATVQGRAAIDLFNVAAFAVNIQQVVKAPELPNVNLEWTFETSDDLEWEVYRVETVSGAPPSTCDGQPDAIERGYAAEYWFYHV